MTSLVTCLHWLVRLISLVPNRLVSICLNLFRLCVETLVINLIIAYTVFDEYFVISLQSWNVLIFRNIAWYFANLTTTLAVANIRYCKLIFGDLRR